MWHTPAEAVNHYYDSSLGSAARFLQVIISDRGSRSSGRPPGEPQAEWRAVLVLAMAALEAGLVEIALAAHHDRILRSSASVENDTQVSHQLARTRGRLIDSLPLSVPSAQKIENFLLTQFGLLPSQIVIPEEARFTARTKRDSWRGAGSGGRVRFSGDWQELGARMDAIQYLRNAIAHGDSRKLDTMPQWAEQLSGEVKSSIWARKKDDTWTLQMPHAVTAVRTTVAVFNTVTNMLCSIIDPSQSTKVTLRQPDVIIEFGGD